jgi:glycine cleavage system H protein
MAIAFTDGGGRKSRRKASVKTLEVHMTVLLVLFTFIAFLLIDYVLTRKRVPAYAAAPGPQREMAAPRLPAAVVGGFRVPDNLRYHPGHTWALSESPTLVRVGMDDFAAKLAGEIDHITMPQRGQWVRQGQKLMTLHRDGVSVDMMSPIEGSVAEINESAVEHPEVARQDPYGDGWLLTVQAPDAKINFRNLLGGALARWWTEESASRLQRQIPSALGALAQDGGVAMENLTGNLPDKRWAEVTREFFLN